MRARFFGLFVIASLVLLFAMPAVAQQDAGTTLRVMPHADLSILDPHWTGAYITHGLRHAVCNSQRVAAAAADGRRVDDSTLCRRAETLAVAEPPSSAEPVHLLVDSTGLKLSGAGEW